MKTKSNNAAWTDTAYAPPLLTTLDKTYNLKIKQTANPPHTPNDSPIGHFPHSSPHTCGTSKSDLHDLQHMSYSDDSFLKYA